MGILVIALSINTRPLSALELTLSGLIMGSRVDTASDNHNPHVIISNYMYDVMFRQRADMGSREGRYVCMRGPIWVLESGLIWIWNHKLYRPG